MKWACESWPAGSPFWDLVHYQMFYQPDGSRAIICDYYGALMLTVNRGDGTAGKDYGLGLYIRPDGANKEQAWRKAVTKARELLACTQS
jgi:hypothetical protein